jgi:hypothetical protein
MFSVEAAEDELGVENVVRSTAKRLRLSELRRGKLRE